MSEKIVLITGGSRGLGAGAVERLSKEGDRVIFTYNKSEKEAFEIEGRLTNSHAVKCDQSSEEQVVSCVNQVAEEYGRLDVLINNACSAFRPADFFSSGWDQYQQLLDTNVKGAFLFTREAAGVMKKQGGGKVINVLSSYVLNAPPGKIAFYITAKYALLGMSKAAAVELAPFGITVNMISPGLMKTELSSYLPPRLLEALGEKNPMKRLTGIGDAVGVLEFLVSDASSFINGANIPINGGETL